MKIGIVGHEAAKFTPETEEQAREAIREILKQNCTKVISGGCHLGGIDIWAVEEAVKLNIPYKEYKPTKLNWSEGFKPRNIDIANNSDIVYCIVVKELPETYTGMKFKNCYHCNTDSHVKSGGCWTAWYAHKLGKIVKWIII